MSEAGGVLMRDAGDVLINDHGDVLVTDAVDVLMNDAGDDLMSNAGDALKIFKLSYWLYWVLKWPFLASYFQKNYFQAISIIL